MARIDNLTNFLTDVADSIRSKTGKTQSIACEDFDTEIESISGSANLQTKSVTITENGTTSVTPDTGYDGISSVNITTNVSSGGDIPAVGTIFSEWDSSGYPHKAEYVGRNVVGSYYFSAFQNNLGINAYLETIILPTNLTLINNFAFYYLTKLKNINLGSTAVTAINYSVFKECRSLQTLEIPTTVTKILGYAFSNCRALETITINNSNNNPFENIEEIDEYAFSSTPSLTFKKLLLPSIVTISSTSSDYQIFSNNSTIEYIWVGENVSKIGKWTFSSLNSLKKIYVNQTRSQLTSTSSYGLNYGFSNNKISSSDVICNDDEGWLTKEEFWNNL